MKILRESQVRELNQLLRQSRRTLREAQQAIEAKDELLKSAAHRIAELEDAFLTEKRCHMVVASAAAQAIADGVDIRDELDAIALQLRSDVARLEEWFVREDS